MLLGDVRGKQATWRLLAADGTTLATGDISASYTDIDSLGAATLEIEGSAQIFEVISK